MPSRLWSVPPAVCHVSRVCQSQRLSLKIKCTPVNGGYSGPDGTIELTVFNGGKWVEPCRPIVVGGMPAPGADPVVRSSGTRSHDRIGGRQMAGPRLYNRARLSFHDRPVRTHDHLSARIGHRP